MPRPITARRTNKRFRPFHDRVNGKGKLKQTIHSIVRNDYNVGEDPTADLQRTKVLSQQEIGVCFDAHRISEPVLKKPKGRPRKESEKHSPVTGSNRTMQNKNSSSEPVHKDMVPTTESSLFQ